MTNYETLNRETDSNPSQEMFSIVKNSKGKDKIIFNLTEALCFLTTSGFYRLQISNGSEFNYCFIRIKDERIERVATWMIRDFIIEHIKTNIKNPLVLEHFYSKIDCLLSDNKLKRLKVFTEDLNKFEPDVQRTYYNNGQVEITSHDIRPEQPICNIWHSRIISRDFHRIEIIKSIVKEKDNFQWELTEDGRKCEFLQYIINTSNNYFTHDNPRKTTNEENTEWLHHIVNKITTIGFLLTDWNYLSDRQVVVAKNHPIKGTEPLRSGAGKSVLGYAISNIKNQLFVYTPCLKRNHYKTIQSDVTKSTRNIFIDSVRPKSELNKILNWNTCPTSVNSNNQKRHIISVEKLSKIMISTNCDIRNSEKGPKKYHIAYMEFSSWYNNEHSLIDDFHHMFFYDWDKYQWALFDNLMAECVMYYLRSLEQIWYKEGRGAVPPPIQQR